MDVENEKLARSEVKDETAGVNRRVDEITLVGRDKVAFEEGGEIGLTGRKIGVVRLERAERETARRSIANGRDFRLRDVFHLACDRRGVVEQAADGLRDHAHDAFADAADDSGDASLLTSFADVVDESGDAAADAVEKACLSSRFVRLVLVAHRERLHAGDERVGDAFHRVQQAERRVGEKLLRAFPDAPEELAGTLLQTVERLVDEGAEPLTDVHHELCRVAQNVDGAENHVESHFRLTDVVQCQLVPQVVDGDVERVHVEGRQVQTRVVQVADDVASGVEHRLKELGNEGVVQKRARDRVLRGRAERDLRANGTEVHVFYEEVQTR